MNRSINTQVCSPARRSRRATLGLVLSAFLLTLMGALLFGSTAHAEIETITYLHTDHLGSPVLATDQHGDVVWEQDYGPWGERLQTGGQRDVSYTGHFEEGELDLIYAGARWYDPEVGRFLSPDAVGFQQGGAAHFNRYVYGANNPYRYVDPDGNAFETPWDIANIATGVASFTANAAAGNYISAALDGLGLVVDGVAAVVPGVPGGAGVTLKALREGGEAVAKGTAGGTRAGKSFTSKGKAEIDTANAERHGGANVCENCGTQVVPGKRSQRGVTPPGNERQRDHIIPKSKGGDGDPSNGQILCRNCNLDKSDKL